MTLANSVLVSTIRATSSSGSVDGKKLGRVTLLLVPRSPTSKSSILVVDALTISVKTFVVDSPAASGPDSVELESDGEVLNPKIVGLGLAVVAVVIGANVNRFGRKTPANPVEIVRPVVNCEVSGNVTVFVVCLGGAVVGENVKKFGRNIPENPVDMVLPVVMSVASLPSVVVLVVVRVVVVVVSVFVVVVVEVLVGIVDVVDILVVVDSRLIPKFSSKSVSDTKIFSVVVSELSEDNPNSSPSVKELF